MQVSSLIKKMLGSNMLSVPRSVLSKSPPHIIVIVADDLGWDEVSWHNPAILTPNMEVTSH